MPWQPDDAIKHTHLATKRVRSELWAKVANEELRKANDEGRAIRIANAALNRYVRAKKDGHS